MFLIKKEEGCHEGIPLSVEPKHFSSPIMVSKPLSKQGGLVIPGFYEMRYLLPGGDELHIIANHDQKKVELILSTYHPHIIFQLPGNRPASLIAHTMAKLRTYSLRSAHYFGPPTPSQEKKNEIVTHCIKALSQLLAEERRIAPQDYRSQENLRHQVIDILELGRGKNYLLANNLLVSNGQLEEILRALIYEVEAYSFNHQHAVSLADQQLYGRDNDNDSETCRAETPLIWSSKISLAENEESIEDAIRAIAHLYQLNPASNIQPRRFYRFFEFLSGLWQDSRAWVNYLSSKDKPAHTRFTLNTGDDLTETQVLPYYFFNGLPQNNYSQLSDLVDALLQAEDKFFQAIQGEPSLPQQQMFMRSRQFQGKYTEQEAQLILESQDCGTWIVLPESNTVLLRFNNQIRKIRYCLTAQNHYCPLPDESDLLTLIQVGKRHLYLPERIRVGLIAFFTRFPYFFVNFYQSLKNFIQEDIYQDFIHYIHAGHSELLPPEQQLLAPLPSPKRHSLDSHSFANGMDPILKEKLDKAIRDWLHTHQHRLVHAEHLPLPDIYTNPIHRAVSITRHIGSFFIKETEKSPIIGTLAISAYLYGLSAILTPKLLASFLTHLHLQTLVYGIEPTQALGRLLSHGKLSEALSAAIIYWQGMKSALNPDQVFEDLLTALKEKPAEVSIIVTLALSLGYGLCKIIPAFQREMGPFPYPNYAALGAKGGAALYDTIMHPGDDWFLGTIKWLLGNILTFLKLCLSPFIEWYYFGYEEGLRKGLKKSAKLFLHTLQTFVAASLDLLLIAISVPFQELATLCVHIPFIGITSLVSKSVGALGNMEDLGHAILTLGSHLQAWNFLIDFRLSPLYGFQKPTLYLHQSFLAKMAIVIFWLATLPLQILKNILLIPSDFFCLLVRGCLTAFIPLVKVLAFGIGSLLKPSGFIWDHSLGYLFQALAYGITFISHTINFYAGQLRRTILSEIQIYRSKIYQWGFATQGKADQFSEDIDYWLANPILIEQLPHSKNDCFLHFFKPNLQQHSPPVAKNDLHCFSI